MKKIAEDIFRQRLLIEGYYRINVDERIIENYFNEICIRLNLRMYGAPIVFSPGGQGKEENQGYDAFVPLIDSGISVYVWTTKKFVSIVLYTCKEFDVEQAVQTTSVFFKIDKMVSQIF